MVRGIKGVMDHSYGLSGGRLAMGRPRCRRVRADAVLKVTVTWK